MTCAIYSSLFWSFNMALSQATHFAHPKRSPYRQDGFQNHDKVYTKTGIHRLSRWNEIITSSWLINVMVYNHSLKSPRQKINKWLSYLAKTLLFQQKVFHTRSTSWSSVHNLSSWCTLVDVTYKSNKNSCHMIGLFILQTSHAQWTNNRKPMWTLRLSTKIGFNSKSKFVGVGENSLRKKCYNKMKKGLSVTEESSP